MNSSGSFDDTSGNAGLDSGMHRFLAPIVGIVGIIGTLSVYTIVTIRENRLVQSQFNTDAGKRCAAIEEQFGRQTGLMTALRAFYDSSELIKREEFVGFTSSLLSDYAPVAAAGWAPRIGADGLEQFENHIRKEVFPDFSVYGVADNGNKIRIENQEEYFPVLYVAPEEWSESVVGNDLASRVTTRTAIRRARDSGNFTIAEFSGDAPFDAGILMVQPVYQRKRLRNETVDKNRLTGVYIATLNVEALVRHALTPMTPAEIDFAIYDRAAANDRQLVFFHPAAGRDRSATPPANYEPYRGSEIRDEAEIEIGGRRFAVQCVPTSAYLDSRRTHAPVLSLIVGFLVTGLIVAILSLMRNRGDAIRKLVDKRTADARVRTRELAAANKKLEDEVKHRKTLETKAMEASRAKSEFLATMSHELRTPLNAIIGYSEMLCNQLPGTLNEKQLRYVQNIRSSGKRLLLLINDILDLAKIEAGRMTLDLNVLAIGDVIQSSIDSTLPKANERMVSIKCHIADELPPILGDVKRLHQVFCNLLDNAIKFSDKGASVTIAARRSSLDRSMTFDDTGTINKLYQVERAFRNQMNDPVQSIQTPGDNRTAADFRSITFVEVSVSDNGIGIAPENHSRVFSQFEQVDSSYSRSRGGSGLGLPLVKRIVQMHGGAVVVDSDGTPGKGCVFTCYLRAAASTTDRPKQSLYMGADESTAANNNGDSGELILIIEDDRAAWDILGSTLTRAGYSVLFVSHGEDGLKMAAEKKPFAILLDMILPTIDGWRVLTTLKGNQETRSIPVIVTSVSDHDQPDQDVVEWMVKPVDKDLLLKRLSEIRSGTS